MINTTVHRLNKLALITVLASTLLVSACGALAAEYKGKQFARAATKFYQAMLFGFHMWWKTKGFIIPFALIDLPFSLVYDVMHLSSTKGKTCKSRV